MFENAASGHSSYIICALRSARVISRLSKCMLDGYFLKEEVKENIIFVSYALIYLYI